MRMDCDCGRVPAINCTNSHAIYQCRQTSSARALHFFCRLLLFFCGSASYGINNLRCLLLLSSCLVDPINCRGVVGSLSLIFDGIFQNSIDRYSRSNNISREVHIAYTKHKIQQ